MALCPNGDLKFAGGSGSPLVSYHEVVKGRSCEWDGGF